MPIRHAVPASRTAGTLALLSLALVGCSSGGSGGDPGPAPSPAPMSPAPWSGERLRPSQVPGAYLTEWSRAGNAARCALVAPASTDAGATPRAAAFGGGWGVAYDLPDRRSAFGVAGTGVEPGPDTYDDWPYRMEWRDGSRAGYGPEGGSGPRLLAYLRIAGQDCLYNVWSHLGRDHLEDLLGSLRFVATGTAG